MHLCLQNWCKGHSRVANNLGGLFCRLMSSSEIATALRPFYFAVHPDLFGRFPDQRAVNEESLKLLSAHLEALNQKRMLPSTPSVLPFYVRSSTIEKQSKLVRIPLERSTDPKKVLKRILETCDLSTDYVDKMKPDSPSSSNFSSSFNVKTEYKYSTDGKEDEFSEYIIYQDIQKTKEEKTLNKWLKNNVEMARQRTDALIGLREEITKLKDHVAARLKLKDLRYECGWNVNHFRGCLKSLESMANLHFNDMKHLEGRILVFAPFTGISLDGHVMLFTGDVQHNWIDFIRKIPKHDAYLKKIPAYEYALSQVLRNIKIGRRKFMPKTQAGFYASHLRKVTTSLLDYLTRYKYPKTWPEQLDEYEIVIESEAGPLMVTPTGQIIAPSTCPGSLLVDFITNNLKVAHERNETYQRTKHVEKNLHDNCITALNLATLTKDDSITPEKMIDCLERLLSSSASLKLENSDLFITHYYSVLSDGTICIPWNWKF